FDTNYPQFMVNVDEAKAQRAGYSVQSILDVMQDYYGGLYISNFNRFGKLYRVNVQAEPESRASKESLQNITVRNDKGEMAHISSIVELEHVYGHTNISCYIFYNNIVFT